MSNPNAGYNPFIIENPEEAMKGGGSTYVSFNAMEEPGVMVGTLSHFEVNPTDSTKIRGKFVALEAKEGLDWEETNNKPFIGASFSMDFDPASENPQYENLSKTNKYLAMAADKAGINKQFHALMDRAAKLTPGSEEMSKLYVSFINDVFSKAPYANLVSINVTYSPRDNGGYYRNPKPYLLTQFYYYGYKGFDAICRPNTPAGIAELQKEVEKAKEAGNALVNDGGQPGGTPTTYGTSTPESGTSEW